MTKKLSIKLIALEKGITCIGLRRISALVKTIYPKTTTYIYDLRAQTSDSFLKSWIRSVHPENDAIPINERLVEELAEADVLGVSCVSLFSDQANKLISLVKKRNPETIIIWGGVHAMLFPEDSIKYADIVCVSEGEKQFLSLLDKIETKKDFSNLPGFWVRLNGVIKRNDLIPLMTNEELEKMPFQDYGFDIKYVTSNSIKPMTKDIYVAKLGSSYTTMWVMGCPNRCTYCANEKFLSSNKEYGKLRRASAEFIIEEIVQVRKKHDYITHVILVDDSLAMLKAEELKHFAELWREKVRLPINIPGFHPLTVDREKVDILVSAGMKKLRMGIQSGSEKTLAFYGRKTSRERILKSAEVLASFYPKINPPNYDIIIDNPMETIEDKKATLSLLRELKRPFMLYIYSLRSFPGTNLWDFEQENPEIGIQPYTKNYQYIFDRWMGIMVFILGLYNPSDYIFSVWDSLAKSDRASRILFPMVRIAYLVKRLYYEMKVSNLEPVAEVSPALLKCILKIKKAF